MNFVVGVDVGTRMTRALVMDETGEERGRICQATGARLEVAAQQQVAASLFISPSTVKTNLAKVYCKLGVTGRAQLATAMAHRSA